MQVRHGRLQDDRPIDPEVRNQDPSPRLAVAPREKHVAALARDGDGVNGNRTRGAMKPFLIGIAGGTGSGKTTVARRIYESLHLDAAVFLDHDSYYKELGHLTLEERSRVNYDHPESLDTELFLEHLHELIAGRPIEKPGYDSTPPTRAAARGGA